MRFRFSKAAVDLDFIRVDADAFDRCPSESIDFAIMEDTQDAVVFPLDAGWNDLGSWRALWDVGNKDKAGNVVTGDTLILGAKDSYVRAEGLLAAAVGVEDLIIVATKDAVLVAHKERAQDAKIIAKKLDAESRIESEAHREVYCPWGKYELIDSGDRYKVKRLTVKPGARLSLQKHEHRAEHWVVVSGSATVAKGNATFSLAENESVYIPAGVTHSLANVTKAPLEVIEVQSGTYLSENDIVRFEDKYGRA